MNGRLSRRGLLACLAASVMLGCEDNSGAPAPKPGPAPAPPPDAEKLFKRPAKIPSTKPGGMGLATPPDRSSSGPARA